jgi:nitrate reductase gamma subunit
MTGIVWLIVTFCVITIFLILMMYRIVYYSRQRVHLRWELAPVPRDKGKTRYGGSYLEDYEWWRKPRRQTRIAPVIFMVQEIFTLKSVWGNNRSLWPFSMSLHFGIYFIILALIFYFIIALLMIMEISASALDVFYGITTVVVTAGCILGIIGSLGLVLKRSFDTNLRNFSSFSSYFRLILLLAVFTSGGVSMLLPGDYALEMSLYTRGIITLDKNISVSIASSVHILISFLFIIYLPFTNMVHFITKHFTYYGVRWNDTSLDDGLAEKLNGLIAQKANWSAGHTKAGETVEKT